MKPTIFSFTCNMFDFLTKKKDILRICVEENMVKKAQKLVTLHQNTTKKALTKENWHCKEKCEHIQTN